MLARKLETFSVFQSRLPIHNPRGLQIDFFKHPNTIAMNIHEYTVLSAGRVGQTKNICNKHSSVLIYHCVCRLPNPRLPVNEMAFRSSVDERTHEIVTSLTITHILHNITREINEHNNNYGNRVLFFFLFCFIFSFAFHFPLGFSRAFSFTNILCDDDAGVRRHWTRLSGIIFFYCDLWMPNGCSRRNLFAASRCTHFQ